MKKMDIYIKPDDVNRYFPVCLDIDDKELLENMKKNSKKFGYKSHEIIVKESK